MVLRLILTPYYWLLAEKARKLDAPGADLANIFTIRNPKDTDSILSAIEGAKKAVVVGSSFIGMEAAASLIQQGLEVTVVSPDEVPFKRFWELN